MCRCRDHRGGGADHDHEHAERGGGDGGEDGCMRAAACLARGDEAAGVLPVGSSRAVLRDDSKCVSRQSRH